MFGMHDASGVCICDMRVEYVLPVDNHRTTRYRVGCEGMSVSTYQQKRFDVHSPTKMQINEVRYC